MNQSHPLRTSVFQVNARRTIRMNVGNTIRILGHISHSLRSVLEK